jgi:hypothetical protein
MRELALLLCGLDLRLQTAAIPENKREYYDIWLYQISRQIKSAGLQPQGKNKQLYPADEMFALAHLMTDETITRADPDALPSGCHHHCQSEPGQELVNATGRSHRCWNWA